MAIYYLFDNELIMRGELHMKDPLKLLGELFVGFDEEENTDDIGFYLDNGWVFFLSILIGLSPIIITLIFLGGK